MPIHPWLAAKFELIRDIPSFEAALGDPQYGARLMEFLQDPQPWAPPAGVTTENDVATGPHGTVPLRVFRPTGDPANPTSALLWMHGGGFVIGSVDATDSIIPAYELAQRSGAVVVSVDYRLALDGVQYPVPLDDTLAAWHWLEQQTTRLGLDPQRLFVGGASVGANLATGVAVRLRDANAAMPRGMLLAYPLEHWPTPPTDAALSGELEGLPPMLRLPEQYQFGIVHNYLGRTTDLPNDVVPGNFPVDGLPEAWIAPSEYDDLRPSGELFAQQLTDAGSLVHLQVARGMVHGHLGRGPSLEPVDTNLNFFAEALRS